MYLVPIAWMYVVLMVAIVEAVAPNGTWLGAAFTVVLYGLLPLAIVMYVLGTPARRRGRRAAQAAASAAPDGRDVPPGDAIAPVREER